MSVGEFSVQGYSIRLYANMFSISPPNMFFRVGTVNEGEEFEIHVHTPLSATVRAVNGLLHLNYIEDDYDPNGQIEMNARSDESDIPYSIGLLNGVPRRVIEVAIHILNGDDEADEYRILRNNEGQIIQENADPGHGPDPNNNINRNYNATNVSEGGKRKHRRSKRRTQKARKRA